VRSGRSILAMLALAPALSVASVSSAAALPPVKHVFTIVLENENYDTSFGAASKAPYLSKTLPAQGELLTQYFGIGHQSLDNYIAMVSGQGPNSITQSDCQFFMDLVPGTIGADGQAAGMGCVYPPSVLTIGNQLQSAGLTWRAYGEDMANSTTQAHDCRHPALNSQDSTQSAKAGDQYASRHEPFVYFHSIIDDKARCDAAVVPLGTTTGGLPSGTPSGVTGLATDLKSASTTPNYSFVTPNLCSDGHDAPCVNQPASPSALANVDAFLQTWVPLITNSPAFKKDGLLEVTFDEADTGDATGCCNQTPGPAAPNPGLSGPGGGRTGTVLISPFIRGGTTTSVAYNHYSTLATVEDIFGLTKLGQAKTTSATFGSDIFTKAG
jgi:phosphatidylinositol-3-phosphatase